MHIYMYIYIYIYILLIYTDLCNYIYVYKFIKFKLLGNIVMDLFVLAVSSSFVSSSVIYKSYKS